MNPIERTDKTTAAACRPIGLFDSGLGGLTVLRELRKTLPQENFIYLGDTARTPYGSKSATTVIRYANECAQFLYHQEIKLLVVACNSASAVALSSLEEDAHCPIIGTIEPAVHTALAVTKGRVGVIGTEATIASGVYETRLHELRPNMEIVSKACPLFVPLVEQGMLEGEIVDKIIAHYLDSMRGLIDTLILGCTHYPLLVSSLRQYFGEAVHIVESSKALAAEAQKILSERSLGNDQSTGNRPVEQYFVTDAVSRFNYLGNLFLGLSTVNALKIDV